MIIAATVATTVALTPLLASDNEPAKRLDAAAAVFSEIMAAPDKGIPQELIEKAHCLVMVPDLKTREIRERVPVLSKQERSGLVCARDGPYRGWERGLPDRRVVDGLDHVGDDRTGRRQAAVEPVHVRRGRVRGGRSCGTHGHGSNGCANARGWICWSPQKALSSVCVLLEDAIPH